MMVIACLRGVELFGGDEEEDDSTVAAFSLEEMCLSILTLAADGMLFPVSLPLRETLPPPEGLRREKKKQNLGVAGL